MGKVRTFINSFAGGILSPRLDGRIDLDIYRKGVKTLTNWIPWPLGAVQNRSGSKHIARTKNDGQARLIPFILGQNEEYAVEVGNEYMRFYEDGAQILSQQGFISFGASGYLITSLDGTTWTERANPVKILLAGGVHVANLSLFVIVGFADGTDAYILTSPDGITWTERSNPKNFNLTSVAWSPSLSLFCAAGFADGADAYLVTSPDGVTWTERSNPKNFGLFSIAWSSDLSLFVAVGDSDGVDSYIITSPDGITWTERANPKNFDLNGVTWSEDLDLFVAVGGADGTDAYIITSPDGTTWTERSNPKNFDLIGVTWSSDLSLFVAVGSADGADAYIITSPDGTTWTERSNPKNFTLRSVAWNEDLSLFAAAGFADGTDAYMLTSADGTTWTEQSNPNNVNLFGIIPQGPLTPAEISSPYLTAELNDIAFEQKDNILYLVHENHAPRQLTRIDTTGNDWNISVGGRMVLDEFIMSQEPLADFATSPSAEITVNAVDTSINNRAEITADATVFKSGDIGKKIKAGSGEATILYLIGDGAATGTSVLVDIEATFDSVTYASGDWELEGGGSFQLDPTATGAVKGFIELANTESVDIVGNLIEASTGRWTASGSGTNEYYLTNASAFYPAGEPGDSDILEKGVTMFKANAWTEQANPQNRILQAITHGNNGFVAVGLPSGTNPAYIVTTLDGITWTERSHPKNFGLVGVTWSSALNLFVAVGWADGTDAYIITSPTGATWTERANPKNFGLRGVTWSSALNLFVAVGGADGTDAYIITSPNGEDWTERANPKNFDLHAVTFENSLFVAVGTADGTDAYIVTSPDGITWTERANPKNFELNGVTYGNGVFCAVGDLDGTDAYIVTSANGITWTERSNPKNFNLLGVTWASDLSLFVAVGWEDGVDAYLLTSSDGTTWTERANPKNFALYGVAYGNGLLVAVGWQDGTDAYIITSPDGLSGAGLLSAGNWAWDDNDSLGYKTIYVRLSDEVDPDTYQVGTLPSRRHWLLQINSSISPIVTAATSALLASEVGGFIQINDGLVEIVANINQRRYLCRVLKVLANADSTDIWDLKGKAFSATNGYPGAIVFHEDRLYFAGTDAYPLTLWGSEVGDYDNFIPGTNAGDSLSFTLNAKEASKIVWLISRDILIAGTEGGEWQVGQRGAITTPSSIYARRQTPHGSDIRYPIVAQSNILFVERGNRKLRELTFAFENDSYRAPDKLLLAEHIAVDLIKQLAYQPRNNSIVWGMLESGEVIGMAYEPDFEVSAWFKMATGMSSAGAYDGTDDIESIAVISDSSGVKELWAVVERVVDAGTIRTVEVFKNLFDSDTASDARMLDSYIIDTSLSTTVSGLDHLIGDTVTFIIDGLSTKIGTAVVNSDGEIDISGTGTPAINVVVGIPYTSTLQTMRLEGGGQRGSSQGKLKRVWEVIMRLYRTMGGKVGTTSDESKLVSMRGVATLTNTDIIAKTKQGFDRDGIVTVVQDQPLPITISMMQPEIQENEIS
jgi:hypothetical protein